MEEEIQAAHILQQGFTRQIVIACLDSFSPEYVSDSPGGGVQKNISGCTDKDRIRFCADIRKMLIHGEVDVIFSVLYDFKEKEIENIAWQKMGKCSHAVCMRKENPLAQKKVLKIEDLKQSDFLCISPVLLPEYNRMNFRKYVKKEDFLPNISNYVSSANSLTLNLLTDNDVFLCDRYYSDMKKEEHCLIPLEDTESGFIMAWRKDGHHAYCSRFVQFALEYLEKKGMGF